MITKEKIGWKCPCCASCYAPSITKCTRCIKSEFIDILSLSVGAYILLKSCKRPKKNIVDKCISIYDDIFS